MHEYPLPLDKMPCDDRSYCTPELDYFTPEKNMPGRWAVDSGMVMVDLSHPWGNDQPTWPAGAQPYTTPVQYMSKFNRRTQLMYGFPQHVSTHYDAPSHVCQESPFSDEVALEKFSVVNAFPTRWHKGDGSIVRMVAFIDRNELNDVPTRTYRYGTY